MPPCTCAAGLLNLQTMRICLALLFCLSACGTFPALEGSISDAARNAPYPTLQPLPDDAAKIPVADTTLNARIAALQARAARLRQMNIAALQ